MATIAQRSRLRLAVLLLVLVPACGTEKSHSTQRTWTGTVDTLPSGAVVVRNTSGPRWDTATAWRLEEDLRIGSVEGGAPEGFGAIAAVTADAHDNIYVLEQQAQEIRVFAPDGTYLRTIGSSGAGPGELRRPVGVAIDAQGRVWVPNTGNARYEVFDSLGVPIAQHQRALATVYPFQGGFDAQGRLWDVTLTVTPEQRLDFVFVTVDPASGTVDTMATLRDFRDLAEPLPLSLHLWRPRLTYHLDLRGYIWFGSTGEYRICQRALDGDTLLIIEREIDPISVTAQERLELLADLERGGFAADRALLPASRPIFQRLLVHPEGYLFVGRPDTSVEEGHVIDVFGPDGRYLGEISLSAPLDWTVAPHFTARSLLGVTRDSVDVPYVVRLRLVRPPN
jgi:hypothetical protein